MRTASLLESDLGVNVWFELAWRGGSVNLVQAGLFLACGGVDIR